MIIDTSALIAILKLEPGHEAIARAIEDASTHRVSAATYLELWVVVHRLRDPFISEQLAQLLAEIDQPVTITQAELAQDAYRIFGRGSGHPAKLNFGDCFASALAIERGEPLLFVGDDFRYTDSVTALA